MQNPTSKASENVVKVVTNFYSLVVAPYEHLKMLNSLILYILHYKFHVSLRIAGYIKVLSLQFSLSLATTRLELPNS